jgi:ribosomal protein S16
MVKIRLLRGGAKMRPCDRVVAIDERETSAVLALNLLRLEVTPRHE